MQQLSTPLPLAFVTAHAAAITVLRPRARTVGRHRPARHLMPRSPGLRSRSTSLPRRAPICSACCSRVFRSSRHDAAHIDDHLDAAVQPSIVLMNPPFTVGAYVDGHVADAAWRHLSSAFARLRAGGRLVAITGTGLSPENPKWRPAFERLQQQGTVVFTAAIDGRVYARHGTTAETRLTVIDKMPAADPSRFVASPGKATDVETLLSWIADLPPRTPGGYPDSIGALANGILRRCRHAYGRSIRDEVHDRCGITECSQGHPAGSPGCPDDACPTDRDQQHAGRTPCLRAARLDAGGRRPAHRHDL